MQPPRSGRTGGTCGALPNWGRLGTNLRRCVVSHWLVCRIAHDTDAYHPRHSHQPDSIRSIAGQLATHSDNRYHHGNSCVSSVFASRVLTRVRSATAALLAASPVDVDLLCGAHPSDQNMAHPQNVGLNRYNPVMKNIARIGLTFTLAMALLSSANATTKGLSQIVTPELQKPGELSLSFQAQSERIANPYELQAEMGLTKWAEVAIFQGFKPNEEIFATEIGILTQEPYLLSVGFINWSPRVGVDPQPYIQVGYYT